MDFYLNLLTHDTSCLRVLPGSHRPNFFWHTGKIQSSQSQALWDIPPDTIPGNIALETILDDLAIFYHDTFHASLEGGKRQCMFTMNLINHGKTEAELTRIDGYLSRHSSVAHGFKIGGMYTDLMLDAADPEWLRHLAQLHERYALVHPQDPRLRPFSSV